MITIKKMNNTKAPITIVEPQISGIFPTPVYISYMDRPFTPNELDIFNNAEKKLVANAGNMTSADNYILHNPGLENIKNIITAHLQEYVKRIYNPDHQFVPHITQSWANYTKENQYHHTHEHPNSFISGVLYVSADEENDSINLHKKGYAQIKPVPKDWNWYNSDSWFFKVKTGMIIMFPSSTTHNVEQKKGDNTRCSLAFNSFFRGHMGANNQLTELIIE